MAELMEIDLLGIYLSEAYLNSIEKIKKTMQNEVFETRVAGGDC